MDDLLLFKPQMHYVRPIEIHGEAAVNIQGKNEKRRVAGRKPSQMGVIVRRSQYEKMGNEGLTITPSHRHKADW